MICAGLEIFINLCIKKFAVIVDSLGFKEINDHIGTSVHICMVEVELFSWEYMSTLP